jgi:hypothetical protein
VGRAWGVVGTSTYPSIPNTTVNVMRSKRPRRTSPLAQANRPPFITSIVYSANLHSNVSFYSLAYQIHHPYLWRELPCSLHTPANQTSGIEHGIHTSEVNVSNKLKLIISRGNMQLGISACALPQRGALNDLCSSNNLYQIIRLNFTSSTDTFAFRSCLTIPNGG